MYNRKCPVCKSSTIPIKQLMFRRCKCSKCHYTIAYHGIFLTYFTWFGVAALVALGVYLQQAAISLVFSIVIWFAIFMVMLYISALIGPIEKKE